MAGDITHFSMIGFALDTHDGAALLRSAQTHLQAAEARELVRCEPALPGGGTQICVIRDGSGAELWYGLRSDDRGAEIITLNPAFVGESRMKLRVDADVSEPEWKPFEVTVSARFAGDEVPVVFDLADPQQATIAKAGTEVTVSMAAFSYEPNLYRDEKAYVAAQKKAGQKFTFAPNMYIPTGTFLEKVGGAMPDNAKLPTPYADFAGTILKASFKTSSAGGGQFWSLLVRTYADATVDVVIDPQSVKLEPKPGYIVQGRFWLTGHIVPPS